MSYRNPADLGALYGSFPNSVPGHAVKQVGSLAITGMTNRMAMYLGRYILVPAGANWYVVDAHDPANPALLATTSPSPGTNCIAVQGKYVFVGATGGVYEYDLTNPKSPVLLGNDGAWGDGFDALSFGRWVAVSAGGPPPFAVGLFDLSIMNSSGCFDIQANNNSITDASYMAAIGDGRYFVLTQPTQNRLATYTYASAVPVVGSLAVGLSAPNGVVGCGRYAYVAQGNGTLAVIDVADVTAPSLVTTLALTGLSTATMVTAAGGYLYVSGGGQVAVVSIKSPAAPSLITSFPVGGSSTSSGDLVVWDRYLAVMDLTNNLLRVFDLSGIDLGAATIGVASVGKLNVHDGASIRGVVRADSVTVGTAGLDVCGDTSFTGNIRGSLVGTTAIAVRATNSTSIATTSGTWLALPFNLTDFDQGTATPQHSNSTNNSYLTCQQAGVYVIHAAVNFAGNATGSRTLALRRTLDNFFVSDTRPASADTTQAMTLIVSGIYTLAVGDYVQAYVLQTSGGALNVNATQSGPGGVSGGVQMSPILSMTRVA